MGSSEIFPLESLGFDPKIDDKKMTEIIQIFKGPPEHWQAAMSFWDGTMTPKNIRSLTFFNERRMPVRSLYPQYDRMTEALLQDTFECPYIARWIASETKFLEQSELLKVSRKKLWVTRSVYTSRPKFRIHLF